MKVMAFLMVKNLPILQAIRKGGQMTCRRSCRASLCCADISWRLFSLASAF